MTDVAAREAEQAAAAGDRSAAPTNVAANARPAAALDPQLFMAARRSDSQRLKDLLKLNDGDQQAGTAEPNAAATAARTAQVICIRDHEFSGTAHLAATSSGAAASRSQLLDGVTSNEGDSLLHVVAACGDSDGFLDCAKVIYRGNYGILVARNNKGDTPLHRAAGAGNANMVSCLIDLMTVEAAGDETVVKEFLMMRNRHGETALHQAVRAASKASMYKLMSVDSELACIPREGEEDTTTSPLYLAISLGKEETARQLILRSNGKLSFSGPDGRNVLHAAVSRGQALPMLLKLLKGVAVDVQQRDRHVRSEPLLSQLTAQQDKDGSTPLHLAASLAGWPHAEFLSQMFQKVWPRSKSTTTLLLDANTSSVYQSDNEGLYPIHVAAVNGNLAVIEILLERCPDSATLRDGKGRTFVHVAAEWEGLDWFSRYEVVEYACRQPQLSSILNVQDNNGDTALHRGVHSGNLEIVNCLIKNRQVDLGIPNKDDLTPLDLSWTKIPRIFYYRWNPRHVILLTLLLVGAPCGGSRVDLCCKKHVINQIDEDKVSQDLTTATQVMGIVSVLVATVTFASAFTLPGGSYQSADDKVGVPGTPILAGSYAFQAFILADVLAFICSSLATFSLIFAGVPAMELSIRHKYVNISTLLLHASARSLVAAFALGLYVALAPVAHNIAIAVCLISFAALLYGNKEVWQLICAANVARVRLGIRILALWGNHGLRLAAWLLLVTFGSFLVIFGFPAIIRKQLAGIVAFSILGWLCLIILAPFATRIMVLLPDSFLSLSKSAIELQRRRRHHHLHR